MDCQARPLPQQPRRVGGATYQVPIEVRPERRTALALRWVVGNARKRGEKTMRERLAAEFMDAAGGQGASIKKREETHKMAQANRAFAHLKW
jgi:small subunit ribosomal protein S7